MIKILFDYKIEKQSFYKIKQSKIIKNNHL